MSPVLTNIVVGIAMLYIGFRLARRPQPAPGKSASASPEKLEVRCEHQLTAEIVPTDAEIRDIAEVFTAEFVDDYIKDMNIDLREHPALVSLMAEVHDAQKESGKLAEGPSNFESWNASMKVEFLIERFDAERRLVAIEHRNGRVAAAVVRELDARRRQAEAAAAFKQPVPKEAK